MGTSGAVTFSGAYHFNDATSIQNHFAGLWSGNEDTFVIIPTSNGQACYTLHVVG